jgi:hypothetical protein
MLPSWCRTSVTVVRPSVKDSRGTKVLDWANTTEHVIYGCQIDSPAAEGDWSNSAEPIKTSGTLYLPPNSDVQRNDKVVVNNETYRVDGDKISLTSPFGKVSYDTCQIVRWD